MATARLIAPEPIEAGLPYTLLFLNFFDPTGAALDLATVEVATFHLRAGLRDDGCSRDPAQLLSVTTAGPVPRLVYSAAWTYVDAQGAVRTGAGYKFTLTEADTASLPLGWAWADLLLKRPGAADDLRPTAVQFRVV